RGPHNLLANIYTAMPIPVTVEGANILTRTLMIFGQGVIRCHPYLYDEVRALQQGDVVGFDRAFWHHLGTMSRNGFRMVGLSLSRGYLARSPVSGEIAPYYRKLAWASTTFAFLTDLALLGLGGTLKRREKLTGRFADLLSWMYLSMATLRRFEAEGQTAADLPTVHWTMHYAFAQMQQAIEGILANLDLPIVGGLLRSVVWSGWRLNPIGTYPTDTLGSQVAQQVQLPGELRDRLTQGIYLPTHPDEALGRLEQAFRLSTAATTSLKTVKTAIKAGQLPQAALPHLLESALSMGIITTDEAALLREAELACREAVQVDAFTPEEYGGTIATVKTF
ncbi:MAG TPA: acyl-CoA dehydrogenase domain-containing protein, partial [Allocoleopsis sp.]